MPITTTTATDNNKEPIVVKLTILGYNLTSRQNAVWNYLLPSILSTLLYIAHISVDLGVTYCQWHNEGNAIWASLTLLFLYAPAVACFVATVSTWEMWPGQDCSGENVRWALVKVVQHVGFPVWSMWRSAEKIFYSIEGVRAWNEEEREESLAYVTAPRTIEFYYFLQGYLQTIPQILLQISILMRNLTDLRQDSIYLSAYSIVINITQMALTTSLYQRFKTQKIGGKNYPWFKPYKYQYDPTIDRFDGVQLRRKTTSTNTRRQNAHRISKIVYCTRDSLYKTYRQIEMDKLIQRDNLSGRLDRKTIKSASYAMTKSNQVRASNNTDSDRLVSSACHLHLASDRNDTDRDNDRESLVVSSCGSSECYLQPVSVNNDNDNDRRTTTGGDIDSEVSSAGSCNPEPVNVSELTRDSREEDAIQQRMLTDTNDNSDDESEIGDELDFPRPIRFVKTLPEDDLAGKLVSFLWWSQFLTARFLSIAAFFYFYPRDTVWILVTHFVLCVAFLLYDVRAHVVRKTKAVFFLFIGLIYIFCIIEFKKQFKKSRWVYNGFFALVFVENLSMCLVWRCSEHWDGMSDTWWLSYVFYMVMGASVLGVCSLGFYNFVNKPEKVVVGTELIEK